jgi:hypothetical protein
VLSSPLLALCSLPSVVRVPACVVCIHCRRITVVAACGLQEGHFALDVAITTLSFFSTYFDMPYPLPKADLVAVPDFAAGAMENWGTASHAPASVVLCQSFVVA